jgi:pyruvate dehydrogenase E2 component (dihydrolipoamide acetyltransferase)
MLTKIVMPDIGEGVESGLVVAVHIQPGDRVQVDDTLVELETDKAVVEIPSTVDGKVAKVMVAEGDEVKVGQIIAEVETEAAAKSADTASAADQTERQEAGTVPPEVVEPANEVKADKPVPTDEPAAAEKKTGPQKASLSLDLPVPASPSIRRMARELGVPVREVAGSGAGGRITEQDLKDYVKNRFAAAPETQPVGFSAAGPPLPDFSRWGEIETRKLDTIRRITAESTTASWHAVPHVTQFDEADITGLEEFIAKNGQTVANAGGKLTVTAVLAKICAAALKRFPRFNASLDMQGQRIIHKKYAHIGIAVDTPRGLLMPVIRDADKKSITALAVEIVDLAQRCRNKKIKPDELEGGSFSISNQGSIGGVGFTPIVLWPQVAILGVSRAAKRPIPAEGGGVAWRNILPLSLSYDHRIIDGADAARFLGWICTSLAYPLTMDLD